MQVQYIILRSDLPHGVQVAQACHAAAEATGHPPTIMVALAVPDETTLRRLAAAFGAQSMTHQLITEDAGPYAGQAMAIGVKPLDDRTAIRKATSNLPLVK